MKSDPLKCEIDYLSVSGPSVILFFPVRLLSRARLVTQREQFFDRSCPRAGDSSRPRDR